MKTIFKSILTTLLVLTLVSSCKKDKAVLEPIKTETSNIDTNKVKYSIEVRCQDSAIIYLNNQILITTNVLNETYPNIIRKEFTFNKGDIIRVKVINKPENENEGAMIHLLKYIPTTQNYNVIEYYKFYPYHFPYLYTYIIK